VTRRKIARLAILFRRQETRRGRSIRIDLVVSHLTELTQSLRSRSKAMAQLVVMYKTPKDKPAFDKHYFEKHVPIAKKIPGLKKYEVSQGPVATPAGPSAYYLVATLQFDDLATIQKAFTSPEGQAAVADVQTFATGGADIFMFDTRQV
jgi:uncharacterized protein (TIGR02118 family)